MAVYVRTSGMERAAKAVRYCVFGAAAVYAGWAVLVCREDLLALANGGSYEPLLEKGAAFFATLPGLLFPVSGWAAGLVGGIFSSAWPQVALCGGLLAALFALLLGLILTCRNNYYEDVLSTAETAQSAITAQKEGQLNEVVPKNREGGQNRAEQGLGRLCHLLQAPGGEPPQRGVSVLQHVPDIHRRDYRRVLLHAGRWAGGHLCLCHLHATVQRGSGTV